MLLNSEDGLNEFESEPIVFPIYGRGIALVAIVGEGINEWNIREAAEFITGPCSCQAKLSNPGVDLLISMDWDRHVKNLTDISIANPLSGIGDFSNRKEEAKRLLESATVKRLGTEGRKHENSGAEPKQFIYLDNELSGTDSPKMAINDHQKWTDFSSLALIFAGVMLVILLGGVILYFKS
jgi:hypothetical protein